MNQKGVLLFGGTFDPVHYGHLLITRHVAEMLRVEKVVFIPAARPPHKYHIKLTSARHRLQMVRLALRDDNLFSVSDCELNRQGPSYTLHTIEYFRQQYGPQTTLYWLIGADTIRELHSWHRVKQLADDCTIVTAGRPGYNLSDLSDLSDLQSVFNPEQITRLRHHILDTPRIGISSTQIRYLVHNHSPVHYLVPPPVREYIKKHGLYLDD